MKEFQQVLKQLHSFLQDLTFHILNVQVSKQDLKNTEIYLESNQQINFTIKCYYLIRMRVNFFLKYDCGDEKKKKLVPAIFTKLNFQMQFKYYNIHITHFILAYLSIHLHELHVLQLLECLKINIWYSGLL